MTDSAAFHSIKLSGRLDTSRVGELETRFYAEVGGIKKAGDVALLDLSAVEFLSSLGIRLLVTAGKMLTQRHVKLGVIAPGSEDVLHALETSGLTQIFRFFDSEDAARAAL